VITITSEPMRPQPKMGVESYKTYAVRAPRGTHTRKISCAAAQCVAHTRGWRTVLDTGQADHRDLALWVRDHSGRRYTWTMAGTVITFDFPPGQECFAGHEEQIRPGIYVVRDGDHRGNPTGRKQKLSERAWLDDFGEHQESLADQQKRG